MYWTVFQYFIACSKTLFLTTKAESAGVDEDVSGLSLVHKRSLSVRIGFGSRSLFIMCY